MWSTYFLYFANINDFGRGRFYFFGFSIGTFLLFVNSIYDLFIGYDYVNYSMTGHLNFVSL